MGFSCFAQESGVDLSKNMVIFLHFINSNQTLKTSRNGANSWGEWWVFGLEKNEELGHQDSMILW
jgi:hypothetical protein